MRTITVSLTIHPSGEVDESPYDKPSSNLSCAYSDALGFVVYRVEAALAVHGSLGGGSSFETVRITLPDGSTLYPGGAVDKQQVCVCVCVCVCVGVCITPLTPLPIPYTHTHLHHHTLTPTTHTPIHPYTHTHTSGG
jgi:hypothetical protein